MKNGRIKLSFSQVNSITPEVTINQNNVKNGIGISKNDTKNSPLNKPEQMYPIVPTTDLLPHRAIG